MRRRPRWLARLQTECHDYKLHINYMITIVVFTGIGLYWFRAIQELTRAVRFATYGAESQQSYNQAAVWSVPRLVLPDIR